MKAAGRPISAALQGRRHVAQAAAQTSAPKLQLPKQSVQVSRMKNGAVVASVENYAPVSRIAIFYNAGSRYEDGSNAGVLHRLRNASCLSTRSVSQFGLTRNLQQLGANVSCSATREHLIYSLDCLRNNVEDSIQFLGHMATSPAFKPWEVDTARARDELDLAMLQIQPNVQMIEALHKAAYRTTLGNSLYMPSSKLGTHTPDMLRAYVEKYLVSGNAAVVGVGVDHDTLVRYASKINMASGSGPAAEAANYWGGEVRIETNSSLVHAAIATSGTDLGSKDLLALAVLQKVMGPAPSIKFSNNVASSKAMKAAGQGTSSPYSASCLNACYSDAGLFGFQVVAQASDMSAVLKSLVEGFGNATKDGGVSDADVKRAKAQLKAASHMELEDSGLVLEDLGVQTLLAGQVLSAEDVDSAIEKVTTADVQAVAKKVINGKPSMAAVGDLYNTPHLDQLL